MAQSPTANGVSDAIKSPFRGKGSGWGGLFYLVTAFLFWPAAAVLWSLMGAVSLEQNLQAICILLLAGIYLVYLNRSRMKPIWNFDAMSMGLLGASYGLLVVAGICARLLPMIAMVPLMASFCVAAASFVRFVFGKKSRRVYLALLGGFILYLIFLVIYPISGWSISAWSGYAAGWILEHFGYQIDLRVLVATGKPFLLFIADNRPFSVLPDCNGFGLLSAGLLVALILLIYRKTPLFAKVLWLAWTVFFVYCINVARICLIVALVPSFSDHFFLLHEGAGLAALYLIIWALWYMLAGWPLRNKG